MTNHERPYWESKGSIARLTSQESMAIQLERRVWQPGAYEYFQFVEGRVSSLGQALVPEILPAGVLPELFQRLAI
ncbi:hypothetical protein KC367_g65 [Hortaea werneckii]|nr:hypothetical protein KC367_g65 [Hortaea werneckii]